MPGVVAVEVAIGERQQVVEQRYTQVMYQSQRDAGEEIVAKKRTDTLQ
jgi:hypothetical protein